MAEVYKAKSFGVEGFEKVLVIKRILPKLATQTRFVEMFVHEAKLAVRLSHANIVQVFDLGRLDTTEIARQAPDRGSKSETPSYFIAMEYVPGLDLSTVLKRCRRLKKSLPVGLAVFVAAEVAKALDHAHRRRDDQSRPLGIVHRDISPQNILLSWEGEVKVTDFGIAKAKDQLDEEGDNGEHEQTRAGHIKGKLAYMSPEQSKAQELDGRSDLFSLGIVLYEMITGDNPFKAPTSFETLRRLQSAEYPPLDLTRPDAPKELIEITNKLLSKAVEDRFVDAGRLHEQLLGYFYSSGDRFGARDLADFLDQFNEASGTGEVLVGEILDEHSSANDRTPVEVPHPTTSPPSRTGSGVFAQGERPDTGSAQRTAEMGERREVTALVLSFPKTHPSGSPVVQRAADILVRYGARVIEEESTQMVALFGLGDADGRDTEAAVRSALVMLRASGGAKVSAGIHVSRILVDAAGEPIPDERLTSLIATTQSFARATEGRVAVSPLAGRIVRSAFATEELPDAGRSAPEGGRVITSARPPAAVYGRFVGRQAELKRLGEILAKASRKRAQVVSIQGEKGVGKTRLLDEMHRRLEKGNYDVAFYKASCPRNGADVAWSGLTAMLQVLCGIQDGDDEARVLQVMPRLRALGLREEECAAVLNQLGAVTRRSSQPPGSAPGTLRAAFLRMVHSLCEDRLHCFSWDDAQFMDQPTLQAIGQIVARQVGSGLRAMLMLASREPPSEMLEGPRHHHLTLGELSDDDSARLISARVGARILPPELLAFCRDRAGGHPLFLEELIKELTDSAALSVMNGAVKARLDGATAIPRTLRTLIASRVSRLDPAGRSLLQGAAILGEPVLTEVLAALVGQTLPHVDRAIARLATRDFLRVTGPAQASFASPMHGEIVLDAIPPEARRELHQAAAGAYIEVFGEDSTEHAARIGNHFYQAGFRDRAATLLARSALHQIRLAQHEPAIRRLIRALDLADLEKRDAEELCKWISALTEAVSRVRAASDLPAVTSRTLKRIDACGSVDQRVLARVHVARALGSVNTFDKMYEQLQEALELAGDDVDLIKRALAVELEMSVRTGDFARGMRVAEKIDSMGMMDDPRILMPIAQVRAACLDTEGALSALDQAEAIADPDDIAFASERQKQRVLTYIYTGDFAAAVEASAKAADLARSAGLRWDLAASLHNLGDAARHMGDLPRSYAALVESRDLAAEAGQERLVALNRIHLAYLDGIKGVKGSEELLKDLIRYAETRRYWTDALEGKCLLAKLLKHQGKTAEAKKEFEQVVEMAQAYGNNLILADAKEEMEGL